MSARKKPPVRMPFEIAGRSVAAGARETVALPVASLPDATPVSLTMRVVHGRLDGPTLFVTGVVHGDEVIGMEIVRRLLRAPALKRMAGTLLAIPIVNVHGFLAQSRYLPDRRDLNRCFPGSEDGPLGEQLAALISREILSRCDAGLDLHSASNHRVNLPQIRTHSLTGAAGDMARAFAAPVVLKSSLREGSLRAAAASVDTPVLVYESGEALRFDERAVRIGVNGVLRVMAHLGMLAAFKAQKRAAQPMTANSSVWVRAPEGGVFVPTARLGDAVKPGAVLGRVSDPFGGDERVVTSEADGVVVGMSRLPLVNRGDAVFHIARVSATARVDAAQLADQAAAEIVFDEDEVR